MPKHLTKVEKAQCKVILALLVVSLLLQKINDKLGKKDGDLPAVVECTKYTDKRLAAAPVDRRNLMVSRIQTMRVRLTKQTSEMPLEAGLVGALRCLTGGLFRVKKGTQLSFIIETFERNLADIEKSLPQFEAQSKEFERILRKTILDL